VEFVVDSQAVAGLAISTTAITTTQYEQEVRKIGRNLGHMYRQRCRYKARLLDPGYWRAREWKIDAEFLRKHAISAQRGGGMLTVEMVQRHAVWAVALQFFSEGGYVLKVGGADGVQ
ncbi:unnamed protein product, partial [Prorocentrum cordatum]